MLDFQKKILGPAGPQVFIFCRQNKYSGRQKLYLRINGFSFVKDNGLSLVYIFPKKKVTYLGGQVGDQAWKFGRHWVKAGRIGDPMGRNIEPWGADFFFPLKPTYKAPMNMKHNYFQLNKNLILATAG